MQITRLLKHPNCVELKTSFQSDGRIEGEVHFNMVLNYLPDNVAALLETYRSRKLLVPNIIVKLYAYQLMRALGYLHAKQIIHRDIKPANILCDMVTHKSMVCDYGSSKFIVKGHPNQCTIGSKPYKAPEIIFGNPHYSFPADLWSAGCVVAELLLA